ncbi:Uncharacterised protein [Mycobacterium tuberculosis]|nr:Uncharacterised protein [Mycobacterium tuberculosis]
MDGVVGAFDRGGVPTAPHVQRGNQQHRGVYPAGYQHRQADIPAGDAQQPAPLRARIGMPVPVARET